MSFGSEIVAAIAAPPAHRRAGQGRQGAGADDAEDGRPWERPGAVRRDCAPHRGGLLLALGDASLLLGALSLALGFLAVTGLCVGAAAWALAARDLRWMRARVMDPAGRSRTARARARAGAGVALSLYAVVLWGWFLLLVT
jgi:hypothetical protein